jgi:hypothetical protein
LHAARDAATVLQTLVPTRAFLINRDQQRIESSERWDNVELPQVTGFASELKAKVVLIRQPNRDGRTISSRNCAERFQVFAFTEPKMGIPDLRGTIILDHDLDDFSVFASREGGDKQNQYDP